jgi:hypothetical protein
MQHTDDTTEARRTAPYDTGKVKIGLYYQRPLPRYLGADAIKLQTALLSKPTGRVSLLTLIFRFFWRFA